MRIYKIISANMPTERVSDMDNNKLKQYFDLGRDCAINGPNMINCNYAIFMTLEGMEAWQSGKDSVTNSKTKDE